MDNPEIPDVFYLVNQHLQTCMTQQVVVEVFRSFA